MISKLMSEKTLRGCFVILMACFGLAPLGQAATLANMMPYLASYLHRHTDAALDYSHSIWISCCLHAIQGISTPLTTMLLPKLGLKPLLFVSWLIHSLGILLTVVTLKVGFWAVICTYAIMVGWGIGSSYGLLLSAAASWFPKHRGLVVGICTCGFGTGAIILTPIQTLIINPNNIAINNESQMFDDEDLLQRVPRCLLIVGGVMSCIQLIGFIFVHPRPEEKKIECDDILMDDFNNNSTLCNESLDDADVPPRRVLRKVDIYLFWTIMCFSIIPLTLITATIKVVGQRSIRDDKYLSTVSTFGAVFNTLSRIGWGPVGDNFSYKVPLIGLNCFYGITLITLPFIPSIPTAGKYLFAVWVVCIYLCVAGNFVFIPFGISRRFGHKYFAANYAIVFSAFLPGSLICSSIVYFVTLEHYLMEIFMACGVICIFSSITALFLHDANSPKYCQAIHCHCSEVD
ncbi:unnamed protein product [Rodentolepis nana]|uniref:Oxalate:formate antiporter n=1 Tax=Rodentolepis nana TaxID=102285 RepID=A0A0R3TXM8_RODNA|nr:unnamed protein product [Rodentolepis nana]